MISGPLVVMSPHYDDGVFACGDLLASFPGSVVVTVFGGRPAEYAALTHWDALAGFRAGEDVVAGRREEDRCALDALGARPWWLPFLDSQYGETAGTGDIRRALVAVLRAAAPGTVLFPLGLFHDDHRLAQEAVLGLMAGTRGPAWLGYEDAIYRRLPGLLDERLGQLRTAGLAPSRLSATAAAAGEAKRRAVACYASQLRALAALGANASDVLEPEGYWALSGAS